MTSPSSTSPAEPFTIRDYGITLLLILIYSLLTFPALGALEFFRHTEADRSLIALEMARSGEYLVPHLLGSVILTKPPLFYWLVASSIALFGGFEEWVLRVPSAVAAILCIGMQYFCCRLFSQSRAFSLLSAVALGTSVIFVTLAHAAEIDMTFGFLSAMTLYLYALSAQRRSLPLCGAAYLVAGLAFLVKGPPILGFLGATAVTFYFFNRSSPDTFGDFLLRNLFGVCAFLAVAGIWLVSISSQVGWESLYHAFEVEVFKRVVEESTHKHGVLFYPGQAILGLAPWSILGGLGFLVALRRGAATARNASSFVVLNPFVILNLCVVLTAIAMLSLAEGKSARYLFPIYPFVANLSIVSLWLLKDSIVERYLLIFGRALFAFLFCASFIAPWFVNLEGVSRADFLWPAILAVLAAGIGLHGISRKNRTLTIAALVGVMVVVQVGMSTIFAPHRNATCSVRGMVREIEAAIPPGARLYTVEMFERWVVYYLIRDGREVFRLDAPRITEAQQLTDRSYLLVSFNEEAWRLRQLEYYDPTVKRLGEFRTERDHLLLIEVASSSLPYLEPLPFFPTVPSYPFYAEVAFQTGASEPE